jgi:hypothetical protein
MKKKTPTQKYIDEAVSKAKDELAGNHISNCNLEQHIEFGETAELIAQGLIENARALGMLASSIKHQSITAISITESNMSAGDVQTHRGEGYEY